MFREFIPASFTYLRSGYSTALFKKDLLAGITVGIVALPLAMAFAIASGVSPEKGLFTAIIAGFITSAIGGSRIQIGGPTGAFVVVIYTIIQRNGYEGLAAATLIASVLLVLSGLLRIGSWIKYVPHPLITGFTTGIALLIFSSQMKDFFGLQMAAPPADFIQKWAAYYSAFPSLHFPTLCLGFATLSFILFIRRWAPQIPWGIAAIVVGTGICSLLDLPVETIRSKFGEIPRNLPWPALPHFHIPKEKLPEIFWDGITIAFLAGIESLLCAVIGDRMMGSSHKSNCELIAQGMANCASIFFGGIPATGAIARTATNVKSGAQTPFAGMIHAMTLLVIILLFGPLVSQVPLASLAAVLIMISWNMSEMAHFVRYFKAPSEDLLILLTTFLLTVFIDITVAVSVGMTLASFLFMKKMSHASRTVSLTSFFHQKGDLDSTFQPQISPGIEVYELEGPFFFGAADLLQKLPINLDNPPQVFILRFGYVPIMDASGMHALKDFYQKCQQTHSILLLSGVQGQTEKDLKKFGVLSLIGEHHIFYQIDEALKKAESLLVKQI